MSYTITINSGTGSGGSTLTYESSATRDVVVPFSAPHKEKTWKKGWGNDWYVHSWDIAGYDGDTPKVDGKNIVIPKGTTGNIAMTPTFMQTPEMQVSPSQYKKSIFKTTLFKKRDSRKLRRNIV